MTYKRYQKINRRIVIQWVKYRMWKTLHVIRSGLRVANVCLCLYAWVRSWHLLFKTIFFFSFTVKHTKETMTNVAISLRGRRGWWNAVAEESVSACFPNYIISLIKFPFSSFTIGLFFLILNMQNEINKSCWKILKSLNISKWRKYF